MSKNCSLSRVHVSPISHLSFFFYISPISYLTFLFHIAFLFANLSSHTSISYVSFSSHCSILSFSSIGTLSVRVSVTHLSHLPLAVSRFLFLSFHPTVPLALSFSKCARVCVFTRLSRPALCSFI